MEKIIPYIAFACFASITATSGMPLLAGGCNIHMKNNSKIECTEEDTECNKNKVEKYELEKTIKS